MYCKQQDSVGASVLGRRVLRTQQLGLKALHNAEDFMRSGI